MKICTGKWLYDVDFMVLTIDACDRPIILEHGLWDQLRVDCGREFALILFIQQSLSALRTNTQRAPYLQTSSTSVNHQFNCIVMTY
jgi:hypothetical protein